MGCIKGCDPESVVWVLINDIWDVTLATGMAKFKIGEFEEGDLASRGARWQKWTALVEDNCDWFGVNEAAKKVKALRIYLSTVGKEFVTWWTVCRNLK